MSSSAKVVVYSMLILGFAVFTSEWLVLRGVPATDSRPAVAIVAASIQFLIIRRWWKSDVAGEGVLCEEPLLQRIGNRRGIEESRPAATVEASELRSDVALAADHVESIRALLEVSTTHQQPIPRAALQNLEMVSKHLRRIERKLNPSLRAEAQEAGHPDLERV